MYEIEFYQRADGREPTREYLEQLGKAARQNKDAKIRYKKVIEYMSVLERIGTRCGTPFVKFIGNSIWELRPVNDRYFFAYWKNNKSLSIN